MTRRSWRALLMFVMVTSGGSAAAGDIPGMWTGSFDSQIGQQNYTYEFAVNDGALTGTAKVADFATEELVATRAK